MKAHRKTLTKLMVLILGSVLCGVPDVLEAQQSSPNDPQQPQSGTTVDPSKGPLTPVPSQNESPAEPTPPNPQSATEPVPASPPPQPRPEQQMQQPLGAATAEGVTTVGGAASRPAGMAIAPDKQKQRRSMLIKVGLIAAAGVAAGTIYGLSKATPSKPKQ